MTDANRTPPSNDAPPQPSAQAAAPASPAQPAPATLPAPTGSSRSSADSSAASPEALSDDVSDGILDRNVESLLSKAGEPPRISDAARARIRESLLAQAGSPAGQSNDQSDVQSGDQLSAARARKRARAFAIGGGVVAAVAAAAAIALVARAPGAPSGPAPKSGAAIAARDGLRTLDDGTTVELSPGAKLEVLGPREVRVSGKALFDVVPGKGRFTVKTPSGTVTALGTRFVVEAEAEATLAAVIRGSVALASTVKSAADVTSHAARAAGELILAAGEGGRIARGQPPVRQPVPRLSHLTSWVKTLRDKQERSGDLPGAPRGTLFARDPNRPGLGESPLPMKQLTVDVVVEHRVARVAIDHTFFNPNPAVLEGNYRFSIPPDAALQRFAMYVDGKLNEAAVVERMRARRVYEDLVYVRQVDPALLEYAGVGKLAMRVYPLPPQQEKRIALAYTQTLPQLYDTWSLAVPLPKIDGAVDDVRFALHLGDCANCEVVSPSHQLKVNRSGQTLELSYEAQGAPPGDTLLINVRERRDRPSVASLREGDDLYLQIRAPAELPKPAAAAPRPRRHWIVLNDVSASRGPLERRAQAELTDALIGELDEEDRVAVLDFDVQVRDILPFTRVLDVDRAALAAKLRDDDGGVGATDAAVAIDAALARFAADSAKDSATQPVILYLGDGVITAGPRQLDELRGHLAGKAMFVGLGLGEGPDTMTLGSLAGATGGLMATIDLSDDLRWRAFDLIATLNTPRVTGLTAQLFDQDGKGLPGALLRSPQLADGEELEVVARVPATTPAVTLELRGTRDGSPWLQRISLDAATAAPGTATFDDRAGYAPRLWAQREIDRLLLAKHEPAPMPACTKQPCPSEAEVREQRNEVLRKQIVELGKRFFLLSRHTSLIVLENDAMYDEYGVKKGSGQTWAPYALPPTIPVVKPSPATSPLPLPDVHTAGGELVRQSLLGLAETPAGVPGYHPETRSSSRKIVASEDNNVAVAGVGSGYGTIGAGKHASADKAPLDGAVIETEKKADKSDSFMEGAGRASAGGERARRGDSAASFDREAQLAGATPGASAGSGADLPAGLPPPAAPAAVAPAESASQPRADAVASSPTAAPAVPAGRASRSSYFYPSGGMISFLTPPALPGARYLRRDMLEDVTELVPALVVDDLRAATDRIRQARGDVSPAAIPTAAEPAALERIERARSAIASGTYRWGEYIFSLDNAQHLGWRRTLSDGLEETAGFDGRELTRRYAELGLDVASQHEGSDALAITLAHFPLWLPPAASLRQGFAVALSGKDDVTLTAPGQTLPSFRLSFEGDHLRRISDRTGHVLAELTWGQTGAPVAASFGGTAMPLAFTAATASIPDAATALLAGPSPGDGGDLVTIDLPIRPAAVRAAELATQPPGTLAWRRAVHQLLASHVTARSWRELLAPGKTLLDTGALWPGEQALLSGAVRLISADERAAYTRGDAPIARYLEVQRLSERRTKSASPAPGNGARGRAARYRLPSDDAARRLPPGPRVDGRFVPAEDDSDLLLATGVSGGALGALATVRQSLALAEAGQTGAALIRASALPAAARLWRVLCATTFAGRTASRDLQSLATLWSSLDGELANIGRYQAALTLLQRSNWRRAAIDAAVGEMAALFENVDLSALPPPADASLAYWFSQSSRGDAGWRATFARWRDRVLTGGDFGHVLALIRALPYGGDADVVRVFDRAAALASGDADQVMTLAVLAAARGQAPWAHAFLTPYVDRAVQLVANAGQPAASISSPGTSDKPATPSTRRDPTLDPWTSDRAAPRGAASAGATSTGATLPAVASPELLRLASQLAQQLGQPTAALRSLQTAIAMDEGGTADDYSRLLQLSREITMSTAPAERDPVITRAKRWARDWRAADPGGGADALLAQLLFAAGDNDAAFRVLSSRIDRDPMSGEAWAAIATQFQSAGRVEQSLPYWHEAVILDQTNPTWRVNNARALAAVGRSAEAQQILREVLRRRWHNRWEWTIYEARELARQLTH